MSSTATAMDLDLQAQTSPSDFLGPQGKLDYFTSKHGIKIAAYYWPAQTHKPRAVVHWAHGHGSYLPFDALADTGPGKFNTYTGSWVEAMNKAGYSVCGIDNQGAGRSESMSGARCYCNSFDEYVDTVVEHIQLVHSLHLPGFPPIKLSTHDQAAIKQQQEHDAAAPAVTVADGAAADGAAGSGHAGKDNSTDAVPRYLLGQSMGACISTLAALRLAPQGQVSGVILLGPMLSLEKVAKKGINQILRHIAPVVSGMLPKWECVKTSRNTLYPELQASYDADPNCWHSNTRARNGYEYTRVTSWLVRGGGMESITYPFIVFHGEQDDMCDPDGSKALFTKAKSEDKTLRMLGHMWHVLTKEPGNQGVLADVLEWLDARTGSTPGIGAPDPVNAALVRELRAAAQQSLAALDKHKLRTASGAAADAAQVEEAVAPAAGSEDAAKERHDSAVAVEAVSRT